jgi:hypothetical protein
VSQIVTDKITRWLFFSVVFAAVPLIVRAIVLITWGHPPGLQALQLARVFGNGDSLLIAMGISISSVGELTPGLRGGTWPRTKIIVIGLNLLVVVVAAVWYGSIAHAAIASVGPLTGQALADAQSGLRAIAYGSLVVLVFSIVTGVWGVGLSEV